MAMWFCPSLHVQWWPGAAWRRLLECQVMSCRVDQQHARKDAHAMCNSYLLTVQNHSRTLKLNRPLCDYICVLKSRSPRRQSGGLSLHPSCIHVDKTGGPVRRDSFRRALRSTSSNEPSCCATVKLSTVGSRAFPVSAAQLWNSLPDDIVLADSMLTFRRLWEIICWAVLPRRCIIGYCNCCPTMLMWHC